MKLRVFLKALRSSSTRTAGVACAGFLLAAFCALAPLRGNTAPPAGMAYDEVTKIVVGGDTPEPGDFTSDFQAAVNAQNSTASAGTHHGLFGGIMNTVGAAMGAMNLFKTGTASTNYYIGGWERTDDAGAQTATIYKPQQHQMVYLNLAQNTYRVMDTNMQPATGMPSPMERARSAGQPAPQPGSGRLEG